MCLSYSTAYLAADLVVSILQHVCQVVLQDVTLQDLITEV